ncbi:Glycogen synthase [Hordeum vulgare]|nr:Glycogen synthase [Hordeum vulgare]
MAGYLTVYCTHDYNVTLVYYLSHYLVDIVSEKAGRVLKLDKIDEGRNWLGTDVLVFHSWHWWPRSGKDQPYLKVQYNAKDLHGKSANKAALTEQLNLASAYPSRPLVGCITRLVAQKGVHLIRHAIYKTAELGGQFVLLGSSPVPEIQSQHDEFEAKFFEERAALEAKYQKMYEPPYSKRHDVVNGVVEVEGVTKDDSGEAAAYQKGLEQNFKFWGLIKFNTLIIQLNN